MSGGGGTAQNPAMPFTRHTAEEPRQAARPRVSPLRRSRNDHTETRGRRGTERVRDGLMEDGRSAALNAGDRPQPAPPAGPAPEPPVLAR